MDEMATILVEETLLRSLPEGTKIKYFYTTHTPHEPSAGPRKHNWDLKNGGDIASIERAKELAEENKRGRWGSSGCVITSYGMEIVEP